MAKPTVTEERDEAAADRRAAAYWRQVANSAPNEAGLARANARDLASQARHKDQDADRQENSRRPGRPLRRRI
jgi:hypothetical protein